VIHLSIPFLISYSIFFIFFSFTLFSYYSFFPFQIERFLQYIAQQSGLKLEETPPSVNPTPNTKTAISKPPPTIPSTVTEEEQPLPKNVMNLRGLTSSFPSSQIVSRIQTPANELPPNASQAQQVSTSN
jgi:hypothetical protein